MVVVVVFVMVIVVIDDNGSGCCDGGAGNSGDCGDYDESREVTEDSVDLSDVVRYKRTNSNTLHL
jgi:hypothetical protein